MDYYIRFPARPKASGSSYYDVFDMQVDIDNDMIDLVSEDGQNQISLDLVCTAEFEKILHGLVNSEQFQEAYATKIHDLRQRLDSCRVNN